MHWCVVCFHTDRLITQILACGSVQVVNPPVFLKVAQPHAWICCGVYIKVRLAYLVHHNLHEKWILQLHHWLNEYIQCVISSQMHKGQKPLCSRLECSLHCRSVHVCLQSSKFVGVGSCLALTQWSGNVWGNDPKKVCAPMSFFSVSVLCGFDFSECGICWFVRLLNTK